ncbi:MAG: hypothetical protein ACK5D9_01445 [Burkholderiales bacterium]|jgi:hypothetical protein
MKNKPIPALVAESADKLGQVSHTVPTLSDLSTYALIGERYLDTQHDLAYVQQIESELAARGIIGFRRLLYEYIAGSALWWNFLLWEWVRLDEKDVRIGWIGNLILFSVSGAAIGYFFGTSAALIGVAIMHTVTLMLGLSLRSSTIIRRSENHDSAT